MTSREIDDFLERMSETSDDDGDSDFSIDSMECENPEFDESEDSAAEEMLVDSDDSGPEEMLVDHDIENGATTSGATSDPSSVPKYTWTSNLENFSPKMTIPREEQPIILADLNRGSTVLDCFFKVFPKSLIMQISNYTNMRLNLLEKTKKKPIQKTSPGEIKIVLGCMLIMCYNRVPAMHMYWSRNKSLQNLAIVEAISRDRYILLMSKLYFNDPEKPSDATKTYFIDEILACLKHTFSNTRSDSTFQSIDEAMAKFKGRSTLKQYLPLKPIKRGIKLWTRCDAVTGYVYDTNIYCGRETEVTEGTLGERVVFKLAESIKSSAVVLAFDRFFTSTILLDTIKFPALGTYISGRKNTPRFQSNLKERGQCEIQKCSEGILGVKWKDTKEVLLMSNCHQPTISVVDRKMKDGSVKEIQCPEAIVFYNNYMGGVDHADHIIGLYDLDRRSNKWWKKVFYRLLLTAVHNAHVIYEELIHKEVPLIGFMVDLAESLNSRGRSEATYKRSRKQGRISKRAKPMENVGDHLPIEKGGRNRCVRCKSRHIEKRTKFVCQQCQVPLCVQCFTPYHT